MIFRSMMKGATTFAFTVLIAAGLVMAACAGESPSAASPGTGTNSAPLAAPAYVDQPAAAVPVPPDSTREAITDRLEAGFRDRITDLVYLSAVGRIAHSEPAKLPDYLAHRENHNECLRGTLAQAADIARTPATEETLVDNLENCLKRQRASWGESSIEQRAQWLRRVLDAAARSHNPARNYAALHHNARQEESYREMAAVYRQCEALASPLSDLAAVQDDPPDVTRQLEYAVQSIGNCMFAVTGMAWPEPTPTASPSPTRESQR